MSTILEVNKVEKKYGDYTALNEVSLTVPKGSIYGLWVQTVLVKPP
jgi:ABC-2 type transport system ATP-binding protein